MTPKCLYWWSWEQGWPVMKTDKEEKVRKWFLQKNHQSWLFINVQFGCWPWEERCENGTRSRAHFQSLTGSSVKHGQAQEREAHWWAVGNPGQAGVSHLLGSDTAKSGKGKKRKTNDWEFKTGHRYRRNIRLMLFSGMTADMAKTTSLDQL